MDTAMIIVNLEDKLKKSEDESHRYWKRCNIVEKERDRAREKLRLIQEILDGNGKDNT